MVAYQGLHIVYRKLSREKKKIEMNVCTCIGDTVIAEKLIKAGADLNESDMAGETPLMAAAKRGIEILFYLLK